MKPSEPRTAHRVFVVTVCLLPDCAMESGGCWRFRMADPQTNQHRVFTNPQALLAALKEGVFASETREPELPTEVW
jgi:hypothetical protein